MTAPAPNAILVIRGGAIGDFILTLPVLAALRRQFPATRLELLGYPNVTGLALAGGLAEAVRPIEAPALAGFFARGGTLAPDWQEYFSGFALILSFLYDPDKIFEENVGRCSRARFIAGTHRPGEGEGRHATTVFLEPLQSLAIFEADEVPRLEAGRFRAGEPGATLVPEDWLAVHPGSGSPRKNWPEPRWRELLRHLGKATAWRILLVGGEAEGDRLDRLAGELPPDRGEVACRWPLARLAGRLAGCRAFLGHDSGITHLAAALGLPGCALWGGSVETVWRPRSDRFEVLRHPAGLAALPPETVARAIERWMRSKAGP